MPVSGPSKKLRKEVTFTNPQKVFFPAAGYTKGDMVKYYIEVAPFILPHLRDRPVTLIRFPDGVDGEKFYEKNAPKFTPPWVKTTAVSRRSTTGTINYIEINDVETLAWCANLAALELHPFLHRAKTPKQPASVAFDLDPGEGADLLDCIDVALLVKQLLDGLGLLALPKVSGSKGLQLFVPLNTKTTYAATASFAKAVAEMLEQQHPDLVVSRMAKALRRDKVMIDWSQNSGSKTTVAVYSMRGKRDRPFISMPVEWKELLAVKKSKKIAALNFSPSDALKRLRKRGDLFAPLLTTKQALPKAFQNLSRPPDDPLGSYRAKRDFSITAEPHDSPGRLKAGAKQRRFVIQKHAASHLHYDFRLEMNGTLKSWAIPKGISTEVGVKRSAFHVEDHPMGYLKFEGTIPKGQYGGGTVMVWDIGTYELLGGSMADGDLKLLLHGKKLIGEWHMFKIRSDYGKDVWLITKAKVRAKPVSAKQDDLSILSRRTMTRIAKDNDAQWQSRKR